MRTGPGEFRRNPVFLGLLLAVAFLSGIYGLRHVSLENSVAAVGCFAISALWLVEFFLVRRTPSVRVTRDEIIVFPALAGRPRRIPWSRVEKVEQRNERTVQLLFGGKRAANISLSLVDRSNRFLLVETLRHSVGPENRKDWRSLPGEARGTRGVPLAVTVAAVLVMAGCFYAGSLCLMRYLVRDELPWEDNDLRVTRLVIPEKENAFYYFSRSGEKIYWPEEEQERILDILEGKEWDREFADDLLGKNEEAFALLDEGLGCERFQVPETTGFDSFAYLTSWERAARLMSLRVLSLFKQEEEERAFSQAMTVVRFGHMIEDSGGLHIHYLRGALVKEIGLRRLRSLIPDASSRPEMLAPYIERLSAYRANERGLKDALRLEYTLKSERIDREVAGMDVGYHFQPHRTKRMCAETYRVLIGNINRSYGKREHLVSGRRRGLGPWARRYLSANGMGETFHRELVEHWEKAQAPKFRENVSVAATQILLALKCYKDNTGKLPRSLGELVPEYFAEVPGDDFDGKPMRYSEERKTVYSVGEDLGDAGGSEGGEVWEMADPTFRIDFE